MRLIDADALMEYTCDSICSECDHQRTITTPCWEIRFQFVQMIDEQPTIEPERKKGHWVCKMDKDPIGYNVKVYVCSECRKMYYRSANYCSNCGADMRGDTDGDMPD